MITLKRHKQNIKNCKGLPTLKLSEALKSKNNNLDIIRVIAALLVIYGHSFAIVSNHSLSDILQPILKFDYSGSLAVKIFFFISGLVVTNSIINSKDHRKYMAVAEAECNTVIDLKLEHDAA